MMLLVILVIQCSFSGKMFNASSLSKRKYMDCIPNLNLCSPVHFCCELYHECRLIRWERYGYYYTCVFQYKEHNMHRIAIETSKQHGKIYGYCLKDGNLCRHSLNCCSINCVNKVCKSQRGRDACYQDYVECSKDDQCCNKHCSSLPKHINSFMKMCMSPPKKV